MDDVSKFILERIHVQPDQMDGTMIDRELLLNFTLYEELKPKIRELKKVFSSSYMTSLQESANVSQRWPLLNLVRQILHLYKYKMKPVRKSDGYTSDGAKKFKRFFLIERNCPTSESKPEENKIIQMDGIEQESM